MKRARKRWREGVLARTGHLLLDVAEFGFRLLRACIEPWIDRRLAALTPKALVPREIQALPQVGSEPTGHAEGIVSLSASREADDLFVQALKQLGYKASEIASMHRAVIEAGKAQAPLAERIQGALGSLRKAS